MCAPNLRYIYNNSTQRARKTICCSGELLGSARAHAAGDAEQIFVHAAFLDAEFASESLRASRFSMQFL